MSRQRGRDTCCLNGKEMREKGDFSRMDYLAKRGPSSCLSMKTGAPSGPAARRDQARPGDGIDGTAVFGSYDSPRDLHLTSRYDLDSHVVEGIEPRDHAETVVHTVELGV